MSDSWGIYNPKTLSYFVGKGGVSFSPKSINERENSLYTIKFDENISYTILILMEMW
jgi:hypothetical protein